MVGVGTDALSKYVEGDTLDVLTGLGNGYDVDSIPDNAVILADTTGIPQMLGLLRELLMRGKECRLILGYETKDHVFMMPQFRNLCNNIEVLTADMASLPLMDHAMGWAEAQPYAIMFIIQIIK